MNPSGPMEPAPQSPTDADGLMERIRAEVEQRRARAQDAAEVTEIAVGSSPALNAEEIMARVRTEIARRHAQSARTALPGEVALAMATMIHEVHLPRWQPAASRLPEQSQYVLGDFLRFDDSDFVDVAYQALLRRPADLEGRQGYLDALRSGAISKVEILGMIRFSEEGRRQAVHVNGLLLPYKLHRWRRVRVIGWLLGMSLAIFRLPRLAWRLQGMEASAAREAQETGRLIGRIADAIEQHFAEEDDALYALRTELTQTVTSRVEGLRAVTERAGALQAMLESVRDSLLTSDETLYRQIESISNSLRASDTERAAQLKVVQEVLASNETKMAEFAKALDTNAETLCGQIETVRNTLRGSDANNAARHKQIADRLSVHEAALSKLDEQAQSDHRSLHALLDRLAFFLDASAQQAGNLAIGNDEDGPSLEEQYASFEQAFRGDREQIKARAAHYLGTLAAAGIEPGDDAVIMDLGSGRGEWLEVLAEHGYRGCGVDSNRGMLEASRARGHEVVEADALDYLRAQPKGSVAAVTSMHMVEHMPHPVVIRLLDEALRVLRPGGVLILETPNPENLLVGSCLFYMDPTHLHPIPPPLLQWTVQQRGFERVVVERLSEHRGSSNLTPVSDKILGAEQINQMIAWFTVAQDYAVIGKKPKPASG